MSLVMANRDPAPHAFTVSSFGTEEPFCRDLVLSMRNGVVAIRADGSIAVINEVAYRILGLTPGARTTSDAR